MKELDFTERNEDGFVEGLYFNHYRDGEVLVKIFFEGMTLSEKPVQDEAHAWLTAEQVTKVISALGD